MDKGNIRLLSVVLATAIGISFTCTIYYPGVMSGDSLGLYHEAITGSIHGNGKIPMTAFLWMTILKIVPSPFGPLLLQNILFWMGLGIIVFLCRLGPIASTMVILAIGLFPTVFALLGTLWSDVLLAAVLTLTVGITLLCERRKSRVLLAAAVITLWCGLSLRFNAFPAIVPLAVWIVVLYFKITERHIVRLRTFIVVLIPLLLAMLLVSEMFRRSVVEPVATGSGAATRALQYSLFHDLAGIAVYSGDLRLPSYVNKSLPNITLSMIRLAYDPADVSLLIHSKQWDSEAFITTKQGNFQELVRVWAEAIAAHPGAYLQRRWDAIAAILQIRGINYPFHTGIDPNDMGIQFVRTPAYEWLTHWLYKTQGFFFRGWLFGCLAIVIVITGVWYRRWSSVVVCSSGLLYVATYLVVSTGADFRYIWWLIVSTLLGALLFLCGRVTQSDID
jgi:hypothetical protein